MRRGLSPVLAAAALGVGALFGACGSQTKTLSAAGAPPAPALTASSAQSTVPTATSQAPSSTAPAQTSTAGGTPAPTQARTAPEPAFVQPQQHAEGLSSATAVLRERGYTAVDTSDYHPSQALRLLIGARSNYVQQAFFFVNGRFIGTDSSQPSAAVKVLSQNDTEVTLAYSLYRRGDPPSSPSGGQAQVRFQLDNGKLVALDAIPSASPTATLSRQ